MEPIALIDTHIAVWLYDDEIDRIPVNAQGVMQSHTLAICPIVEIELSYLHEIGRITVPATEIVGDLASRIGLRVDQAPYSQVISRASDMDWTRDPFDRLQSAQAALSNRPFITKDATIRKHLPQAIWD